MIIWMNTTISFQPRLRDKSSKARQLALEMTQLKIEHQEVQKLTFATDLIVPCTWLPHVIHLIRCWRNRCELTISTFQIWRQSWGLCFGISNYIFSLIQLYIVVNFCLVWTAVFCDLRLEDMNFNGDSYEEISARLAKSDRKVKAHGLVLPKCLRWKKYSRDTCPCMQQGKLEDLDNAASVIKSWKSRPLLRTPFTSKFQFK